MTTENWEPVWKRRLSETQVTTPRKIILSGEKPRRKGIVGMILAFFFLATMAMAVPVMAGNPHGLPPGQGDCSHGSTGKPCKPDPQPSNGQDCEEHGPKEGGVNEDHCSSETPSPSPSASPTASPEPSATPTPTSIPSTSTPPESPTPTLRPSSPSGSTVTSTLPQTDTDPSSSVSGHSTAWVLFMAFVVAVIGGYYAIKDRLSRKR